jgi:hypothetical protein
MARVVSLESIEEARRERLYPGSETSRYLRERAVLSQMQPGGLAPKMGKRPIGGTFNQTMLSKCPGSRVPAVDFVKAVYSDRTGQE